MKVLERDYNLEVCREGEEELRTDRAVRIRISKIADRQSSMEKVDYSVYAVVRKDGGSDSYE